MERRREPRIRVDWPVRIAAVAAAGEGRARDASLSGVLLAVDAELEEKQLAVARITLDHDTVIECAVRVVAKRVQGHEHLYGAEITHISPADRQKLNFALMLVQQNGPRSSLAA